MIEALELAHRIVEDEAIWRAYEHKRELRRLLGSRTPLPEDFCFRLSLTEAEDVQRSRSQIVTLKRGQNIKYLPHAFTEHGAIMAAMVLNSPEAVAMSVFVVRAFMQMREQLAANTAILKRLAEIDQTLLEHNSALRTLWTKLQPLLAPPPAPPKRRIGFNADRP